MRGRSTVAVQVRSGGLLRRGHSKRAKTPAGQSPRNARRAAAVEAPSPLRGKERMKKVLLSAVALITLPMAAVLAQMFTSVRANRGFYVGGEGGLNWLLQNV